MDAAPSFSLPKEERISLLRDMNRLFSQHAHTIVARPLRAIYLMRERLVGEPSVKMMVAVPKKCFKRAVKRNRVKRQLREAYRHNKHPLMGAVDALGDKTLLVAFIWTDKSIYSSPEVNKRMENLLCRLSESVAHSFAEA